MQMFNISKCAFHSISVPFFEELAASGERHPTGKGTYNTRCYCSIGWRDRSSYRRTWWLQLSALSEVAAVRQVRNRATLLGRTRDRAQRQPGGMGQRVRGPRMSLLAGGRGLCWQAWLGASAWRASDAELDSDSVR